MNDPDAIIAHAREQIEARRAAEAQQRWGGPWYWLPVLLVASTLAGFIVAPGTFADKLLLAMGGICGVRPDHSYVLGVQLPLEARDTGIYGAFAITFVLLLSRLGASGLGSRPIKMLLSLFFASMVFDGVNSTVITVGLPGLYESTNLTRLITGLMSGITLGAFLVWLLGVVVFPRTLKAPTQMVVRSFRDVLLPVTLSGAFGAVVLSGASGAYYPVAFLSVVGAVMVLTITALLLVLRVGNLAGQVMSNAQFVVPGMLALLIALAVIALSAAYRWSSIGVITS